MKKIKFNKNEYELIKDHESDGQLKVSFYAPKTLHLGEIEDDVSGIESIDILDESGDVLEQKKGYIFLVNLSKDNGNNPEKSVISEIRATFKKSDIRKEMEEIREVQNMILISMLEG